MSALTRLWNLLSRRRRERELQDEIDTHVALLEDAARTDGLDGDRARHDARRRFGNPTAYREQAVGAGMTAWLADVAQDVRHGLRQMRRSPGLTLAVIVTLALGIGGTTAVFSVVDALFLRAPASVGDPSSLRRLFIGRDSGMMTTGRAGPGFWDDAVVMRPRTSTAALASVAAYASPTIVSLGRGADARSVHASLAGADFFRVLDVPPARGRIFGPRDDQPGAPAAVLIGHELWMTRFGGADDVIGTHVQLGGTLVEIVGVMPNGFIGVDADPVDVWVPPSIAQAVGLESGEGWRADTLGMHFVARLAHGANESTAGLEAASALREAARATPALDPTPEVRMTPIVLRGQNPGPARSGDLLPLWLAVVSALVLLIACANVANLLLARAVARQRDLAMRLSLGAGSWRIARQQLIESLLLALCGGAAGIVATQWAMALMRRFPLPPAAERIDGRLLLFALALSLLTSLLFGLLPAIRATRVDPVKALRQSHASGGLARDRTRRVLVAAQIALSLPLLAGAGLFAQSLRQAWAVKTGFDVDHLLVAKVDLQHASYAPDAREAFYNLAVARLSSVPGVDRAAVAHFPPFSGDVGLPLAWLIPGRAEQMRQINLGNVVGAGYFETVGTRLLRGRGIDATDVRGSELVAVVNESMARLMADNGDVVGRCIPLNRQVRIGGCTRIVGVVEDQQGWFLSPMIRPRIFKAWAQGPDVVPSVFGPPTIVVRAAGDPHRIAAAVQTAIQGLRSDLPFVSVDLPIDSIGTSYRLGATLFGAFAVLALVLAAVGLYGVLGYFVTERTPEIAIRLSLGASRPAVLGLVARQGLALVIVGMIAGLAIALIGARYLQSLLFGITTHDPLSFATATTSLLVVALLAALLPARRATQIDPIVALRQE
ncbi:MAG TPA: ADOP family duplicated permease [Vicinamibacterales bacterium]|jgi:predicted permease|nr:ADOP family duplicated permease [Vicinamibacterales bacterium]